MLHASGPLLPEVETTDLFRWLLEVSDSPPDEMPGETKGPAGAPLRTHAGRGLGIA